MPPKHATQTEDLSYSQRLNINNAKHKTLLASDERMRVFNTHAVWTYAEVNSRTSGE